MAPPTVSRNVRAYDTVIFGTSGKWPARARPLLAVVAAVGTARVAVFNSVLECGSVGRAVQRSLAAVQNNEK